MLEATFHGDATTNDSACLRCRGICTRYRVEIKTSKFVILVSKYSLRDSVEVQR